MCVCVCVCGVCVCVCGVCVRESRDTNKTCLFQIKNMKR